MGGGDGLVTKIVYLNSFIHVGQGGASKTATPYALTLLDTDENEDIDLGYGLGWGVLGTPYGKGAFKEGGSDGYQRYSIIFPETDTGVLIMTNSNNGDSILKKLLEVTIGDTYTPWQWENYIPYDYKPQAKQ